MGIQFDLFAERITGVITQTGDRVVRGVSAAMRDSGEAIAQRAREFAPIDDGDLEKAITVETDRDGINGRLRVWVFIDGSVGGLSVSMEGYDNYAAMLHEFQNVGGPMRPKGERGIPPFYLGPKSFAKDAGRGVVGGKFLERAFDEFQDEVLISAYQRARELV